MGLFDSINGPFEFARHREILASVVRARRARRPDPDDGFMPLHEAAALLQVEARLLEQMLARGEMEMQERPTGLWVRPAVVSRMSVRT